MSKSARPSRYLARNILLNPCIATGRYWQVLRMGMLRVEETKQRGRVSLLVERPDCELFFLRRCFAGTSGLAGTSGITQRLFHLCNSRFPIEGDPLCGNRKLPDLSPLLQFYIFQFLLGRRRRKGSKGEKVPGTVSRSRLEKQVVFASYPHRKPSDDKSSHSKWAPYSLEDFCSSTCCFRTLSCFRG